MFDDLTELLISKFANVIPNPTALRFSPSGDLLVVNGSPGVHVYSSAGVDEGILGDTGTATQQPVDLDFLDDETLLIADQTGSVVRCDADGTGCGAFSNELDGLLPSGAPTAIAVNPAKADTDNDVLVTDPVGKRVIACNSNGGGCGTFGDTADQDSEYDDIFFAPGEVPVSTTTTTSTTSTTLKGGNKKRH
jgi:hypothetical protein